MTKLDLEREAQRLVAEGKMPSLAEVLDAIREVKQNPKHDAPIIHDALVVFTGEKQ